MARIAVVDNDADFLRFMADALAYEGWQIVPCPDTLTAFRVLREETPDLVISDLHIETSHSGFDILTFLQLHPELHRLPAILCTAAEADVAARKEWLDEHGVAVLSKPFELDDLYGLVSSRLETGSATQVG